MTILTIKPRSRLRSSLRPVVQTLAFRSINVLQALSLKGAMGRSIGSRLISHFNNSTAVKETHGV